MNKLDLSIFKALLSNNVIALEFAYMYNHDLFESELKLFAKLMLGYMKAFKSVPTRRVLVEWHGENYSDLINRVFDKIEQLDYNTQEYRFDLERLKKRYVNRTLEEIKSIPEDSNDPNQAFKDMSLKIQTIKAIKEGKGYIQQTVKEHIPEFRERYKAKAECPTQSDRIMCHYSAIDRSIGGFAPADLFLIGGETSAGKSLLLMNMGIQMWKQRNEIWTNPEDIERGYNIAYFSLEMPYEDCFSRFMARLADVPERHLIDAKLTPEEQDRVSKAEEFIERFPYMFDIIDMPRDVTIDEIEVRYNDALLKYRPDVVIVDYMGLMRSPNHARDQDWLKMGHLGGELHEFGRAYSVVMGSAVQLTDVQRGSKEDVQKKTTGVRVGLHRVGRSSHIMHHATLGIQIESRRGEDSYGDLIYHIIKNRRGKRLKATLNKNLTHCSLTDIPIVEPEPNNSSSENKNDEEDKSNGSNTNFQSYNLNSDISAVKEKAMSRFKNV